MYNNNDQMYDSVNGTGPHIAITESVTPEPNTKKFVTHNAVSLYSNLADGKYHRVVISWKYSGPGMDLDSVDDDLYTLSYKVYANNNPSATDNPVTGQQQYVRSQVNAILGGDTARFIITAGNTNVLNTDFNQSIMFPTQNAYTINYFIQTAAGVKTSTVVPGLVTNYPGQGGTQNPIKGQAPVGYMDLGALPEAPFGYKLVAGQNTNVYVTTNPTTNQNPAVNVYNFYYEPAYIPYKVNYYFEDMSKDGNPTVYPVDKLR